MPLPFRLSRRSLLKAAARLGAGAGLALLGLGGAERSEAQEESEGPYFQESATKLTLGNQYYEVDFDKQNGAITRIFDKRGGGVVSEGNAHGSLWAMGRHWDGWSQNPNSEGYVLVAFSHEVPRHRFRYEWLSELRALRMHYEFDNRQFQTDVTVEARVSDRPWFDLVAAVDHVSGPDIDWFSFPHSLTFDYNRAQRAFAPALPGVMFDRTFFEEPHGYQAQYPSGSAFVDLTWLDFGGPTMAWYAVHGPSIYWPAQIGFNGYSGDGQLNHVIAAGLAAGRQLETPIQRCAVGDRPLEIMSRVRHHNRYSEYPSIRQKLGDVSQTALAAVRQSASPRYFGAMDFQQFGERLSGFEPPLIIWLTNYMEQGWVKDQPDVWPPAEELGGVEGYRSAMSSVQRQGTLIQTFVDPPWWAPTSYTGMEYLSGGGSLDELAVIDQIGTPYRHSWPLVGEEEQEGVYVSLYDPRVIEGSDLAMQGHELANSDLVYWDVVGNVWRVFDYHPDAPSPMMRHHSWVDYARKWQHQRLGGEGGWDRLAETFSFFQWQVHDHIGFAVYSGAWGTNTWYAFPASAALLRDKVVQWDGPFRYHRDEIPAFTEATGLAIDALFYLRHQLAMGHGLHLHGFESKEEIDLFASFAHYVCSRYADELLTEFDRSGNVSTSVFGAYTVTAEWSVEEAIDVGRHTLAPGGAVATAQDGSLTGGVFQAYNRQSLSEGEHYLIEQREPPGIILRQPSGTDTPISLRTLDEFSPRVHLTAFNRHDERLDSSLVSVRDDTVRFHYKRISATADERSGFQASVSLGEANAENGVREVDLGWTTTEAVVQGGRPCRREVEMTSTEAQHGYIAFEVTRDLFMGKGEADCVVEVDWYDGSDMNDFWVHLVFDGAAFDHDEGFAHVSSGSASPNNDQQWKTERFHLPKAVFTGRVWNSGADIALVIPRGVCIGKVTVTNADELERRTAAYYTIHDPTQGETLPQGLHLRGWTDATQPIADLNLDGLQAIYAWDAEASSWLLYSPDVPARFNTLDTLEQGRAYYVRVRNGQTLHWPDAPYGGVGFHLQPGRNLVCWLGTPDKPLTDAIAPLRGMKAEPLVSVTLDGQTYDVEESRSATEPLPYGQALWVEIDAVGPTRWLQF